ncbi:hypothetical protein Cni_G04694 [Canna indica]|uniref:Uncharacterized protein n=1 Tax=Canna indica TaxID=4628 RepID=A0AAQ3JVV0_9LILI|nr:hypothetical protein Cni_G04694 [Canna indica]
MAVEVEDDVFFADLSKQIALLIMDDEEDFPLQCPQLHHQELPQMPRMMMPHLLPYRFEVVSHRRESKGTGVFIPRSTAPIRRKNRSRRSTTTAAAAAATTAPADININRQQLHKSAVVTSTNSNLICSSHCSAHPLHAQSTHEGECCVNY